MTITQEATTVKAKVYLEPIAKVIEWQCPECGQVSKATVLAPKKIRKEILEMKDELAQKEEINLVRKIENRTENLLKDLNSIESLTNALNRMLLPPKPKTESEAEEARKPQGWLENHLQRLDLAIYRSGQIYEQVTRIMQATKIDIK